MPEAAYKTWSPEFSGIPVPEGSTGFSPYGIKPIDPDEITAFLDELGPERVISICTDGPSIYLWYWKELK